MSQELKKKEGTPPGPGGVIVRNRSVVNSLRHLCPSETETDVRLPREGILRVLQFEKRFTSKWLDENPYSIRKFVNTKYICGYALKLRMGKNHRYKFQS